jgi:hypothetical protein
MTVSKSNESLVFNTRTLRLIIGALAFAFPSTVIALTGGKITTSISASYHEGETRDVFVGFLFIIGALLIAYKGHLQGRAKRKSENLWDWILSFKWVKVYQEDIISMIGGLAAIFTALHPTACDGCPMNAQARIHTTGALLLFSTVIYFSLVAFLRSVNKKLVRSNPVFRKLAHTIRSIKSLRDVRSSRELRYLLFPTISIFFSIASQISTSYDKNDSSEIALALPPEVKVKPNKLTYMWVAYGKKLSRGIVYLVCGSLITVTLVVFIFFVLTMPDVVAHSITTFIVETISLVFFGIAWMTASQLEYLNQILAWWRSKSRETSTPLQPEAPEPEAA